MEAAEKYMRGEVERFQQKIGIDIPHTRNELWCEEAGRDVVRRYAYGMGDNNPLWSDPVYAGATRWGGQVAPPTFLEITGLTPEEHFPTADEMERASDTFSGLNMMWSGDRIQWYAPLAIGERIGVRRFYVSCALKGSEERGWVAISVCRRVYTNGEGSLLGIWDNDYIHPYNRPDPERIDDPSLGKLDYTETDRQDIDDRLDTEAVRGAMPRFFEEVAVGDQLPPLVKGPLTRSDIVAWMQGAGRHEVLPYRIARQNRREHPDWFRLNDFGFWESWLSVHWDTEAAAGLGGPRPFDLGMMRNAYMAQIVTDWMGDDAILVSLDDRIRGFACVGDLTTVSGRVISTDITGDWPEVSCEVACSNQRGAVTASAVARVRLPTRAAGLPSFPAPPADGGFLPTMTR